MNEKKIILSIIIPVYNVKQYLESTLENVLNQKFRDFELILVDDGSTDGSGKICDRFADADNRVIVIHQKNAGVSAARNAGVASAKGEYIGFVDSDDLIEPAMFETLIDVALRNEAYVVQCRHNRLESVQEVEFTGQERLIDGKTFVREIFTHKGGEYTNQVALWSKIYRKEMFENVHFPEGRTYEDEQETYKLCLFAKKIVMIPDEFYHYVKRENSIITGISAKKMLDKQYALMDRLNYLPKYIPELEEVCVKKFCNFSEHILCQLFDNNEYDAINSASKNLLSQKTEINKHLNIYQKIYYACLKVRFLRNFILKNQFMPIQKFISKIIKK